MANGKAISMSDVQSFINKQRSLYTSFNGSVNTAVSSNTDAVNFYTHVNNAFVFDISLFTAFMALPTPPTHIVAIIGAHPAADVPNNFVKGQPTIIAVACTYDAGTDKYSPLNIALPANEHPPTRLITSFPG